MADSAVTLVGAMLIAPLMKPIIALAYGLVIAERRLQLRAGLSLGMGVAMTVLVAAAVEQAFDLRGPTVLRSQNLTTNTRDATLLAPPGASCE